MVHPTMDATVSLQDRVAAAAQAELDRRAKDISRKEEAEASLLAFVRMFWRVLEPDTKLIEGWVLDALCETLMAITDGHITRICINVPPGSMKSSLLNVLWPAWEWGPQNMPHLRYLSVSYNSDIPERDNLRFTRVISDPVYQSMWGDRVKLVREGAALVENHHTGWKRTTSTDGGTTGWRGDRILLDDMNNPKSVESDAVRKGTNIFIREVMPDRLNSLRDSVIVNLQQRTHEDDATGTIIKYGRGYQFLCIPMEFDPLRMMPLVLRRDDNGDAIQVWNDPRGLDSNGNLLEGLYTDPVRDTLKVRPGSPMAHAEGTLCWPERFGSKEVMDLKSEKGEYAWAGQYQQMPQPRGGGIIRHDWWQLWARPSYPPLGTVVASLDTSIKEGEKNDYNALTVWGAFAEGNDPYPRLILIDAWRIRCSLAELVQKTAETCSDRKVDVLLIEDKARGTDVAAEIARQYASDVTWDTQLIPVNGRGSFAGDKEARLRAVSVMFSGDVRKVPKPGAPPPPPGERGETIDVWSGGLIFEPGTSWSREVVEEVCSFPTAAHDDYTDSTSLALSWIRRHGVVLRKVEWEREDYQSKLFRPRPGVPYAISR